MIPVSKDMKATHLAVKATRYLSEENLKVVPDRDQLVKFICDKRREMRPLGKSASTIEDLVLKPEQKKDHNDELFLLHDDGPEKEERIICYATKKNLEQLRANDTWLCDGTFASCPKIFYQLWVVHAQLEDRVLPFAYFLLPGATEEIYTMAFQILQDGLIDLPDDTEKTLSLQQEQIQMIKKRMLEHLQMKSWQKLGHLDLRLL